MHIVLTTPILVATIALTILLFAIISLTVGSIVRDSMRISTVEETTERLRGLNFEVEVVLDSYDMIVSETTQYDPGFVHQTDEQIALFRENGQLTSIHNHVDNTPPSVQDIAYAASADFSQMIVVTPGCNYHIFRPETGWKTEPELNDAVNKHLRLFRGRRTGQPTIVAKEPDGAVVEAESYEIVSTDKALGAICRDLGYEITKEII